MTTYETRSVTCAACGTTSEHQRAVDVPSFGWPDLDLRPPEMRRGTMHTWLQDCPSCGFVAADISKRSDAERAAIEGPVNAPTWAEMLGQRGGVDALARRFERRAFLESQIDKPGLAGFRMLCAAWDADDRKDTTGARFYREQAAPLFEAALANDPDAKEATDWTIQLVDVLRRIGKWDEADEYCDRLLGHPTPKIHGIGRFQNRMIAEGDDGRFTIAIVMEEPS